MTSRLLDFQEISNLPLSIINTPPPPCVKNQGVVIKYTSNIFLTTRVYVCAPHPSKIFATLKWVYRETGNNYSYV